MARPLDAGSGDDRVATQRALARLKREMADARRAEVRAKLAEASIMPVEEAREQILALVAGIRRALDRAPAYLPASLSAEEREACAAAIQQAIHSAMLTIAKYGEPDAQA
jgi:hypothetical protein